MAVLGVQGEDNRTMIDIAICFLGIVGIIACRIIENIMREHDREKALGYEFERYCGVRMEEKR